MPHNPPDHHVVYQLQETDLAALITAVMTGLGEPFRGCPRLYRGLKRSLAIMVAEIQNTGNLLALSEVHVLRRSFQKIASEFNAALRSDLVNARYRQLQADEKAKRGWQFSLLPLWLTDSSNHSKKDAKPWTQTLYPCLGMLHEILQSPSRPELRVAELFTDDPEVIQRLTSVVNDFNALVELLDDSQYLDEEDPIEKGHPKPQISDAAFQGETSIRHLSQVLYQTLHENWPCQLDEHEHSGKLGCCVEAKFCLDPQWSLRDPDPLHDSFFVMLAAPDVIQECRVDLHPIRSDCPSSLAKPVINEVSVTNESSTLACLVDSEASREVCLQLTKDENNRLWGQRLGQPLEVLQLEEEYVERSLESLRNVLEVVKPTYAAKRVLGVILARSLLHLLEGPWINWSLSIDDISLFCRVQNDRPYPMFDKVFLSTVFRVNDKGPQENRRSPYSIHPFPTILALGIILAEIELGDELSDIYSQPSFSELRNKPSALAKGLWKECQRRFHLETGLMRTVNFCVDRTSFLPFANISSEKLFADPTFVNTYYMNAVRPLEEDLVNGAKWTWDEVNWLQRRNLDDDGICKIITKLKNDLTSDGNAHHPEPTQCNRGKPSKSTLALSSIPEADNPGDVIPHHLSNSAPPRPKTKDTFEVAIICALPLEANAVLQAFDHIWDEDTYTYEKDANDPNFYTLGVMGNRNVVLAHPPHPGKATAANVAAACRMSFKNVKLALVVGVCGGVPRKQNNEEILLGDVIVSKGVIQYDHGRQFSDQFRRKIDVEASLGRPNARIGSFLAALETPFYRSSVQQKITNFLTDLNDETTSYPGEDKDKLFEASYRHKHRDDQRCEACANCWQHGDPVCFDAPESTCQELGCDDAKLVSRHRQNRKNKPMLHVGLIASGDSVVKSSAHRDQIAERENVVAFEMEGAGVWDAMPCVIIKGVCDYSDSHKNKLWQVYAATTAAACVKSLIQYW